MPRSAAKKQKSVPNLGQLAEALVAEWLLRQGYDLLHQRWSCRWGELDLVLLEPVGLGQLAVGQEIATTAAERSPSLVFVEVKARTGRNWDQNGLLAITSKKQAKLWQAAELFLAAFPELTSLPCRFDLALVVAQQCPILAAPAPVPDPIAADGWRSQPIDLGQSVAIAHYRLTLQNYLKNVLIEN